MADAKTGWELHRRGHFDEIVTAYDQVRPTYPSRMLDDIMAYMGQDTGLRALEIGAGTGKATVPFLRAGCDVTAVELGERMAAFLLERFRECPNFTVLNTAFEDAELDEGRYGLIYAASAFHWVKAELGCPKAFRLLKSGGVIALLRYNDAPADGEARYEDIRKAIRAHGGHHTAEYVFQLYIGRKP